MKVAVSIVSPPVRSSPARSTPAEPSPNPPLDASTFVLQTVRALWDSLPMLLIGGLGFSLFAAPAFILFVLGWVGPALVAVALLVAPAWSALLHMQASLLSGRAATVVDMGRTFPRFWRASVRLSVLGILSAYLLYRLLPGLAAPVAPWPLWAGLIVGLLATALVCALYLYAFPLTVLYDLPLHMTLRNSAILASRHAGNTVGLLGMGVLFALATLYFSLALLFILPTVYGLFIVNHCRLVVAESENQS
jgi:uncharacterized membrane protein YesL